MCRCAVGLTSCEERHAGTVRVQQHKVEGRVGAGPGARDIRRLYGVYVKRWCPGRAAANGRRRKRAKGSARDETDAEALNHSKPDSEKTLARVSPL